MYYSLLLSVWIMHATSAINANSSAPKNALELSAVVEIKLAAKKPATALSTIIVTEAAVLLTTEPPKNHFAIFTKLSYAFIHSSVFSGSYVLRLSLAATALRASLIEPMVPSDMS